MITLFLMIRRPTRSTLCPYTTLCRSGRGQEVGGHAPGQVFEVPELTPDGGQRGGDDGLVERGQEHRRSEEHTTELQSRQYLVCRLLLEKNTEVPSCRC